MVDAVLYIPVDKCLEVIYRIIDAMIGYTTLREVICADFCRTVTGRDQCFAPRGDVIHIFLMLFIVNKRA